MNKRFHFGGSVALIALLFLTASGICDARPGQPVPRHKCCPTQSAPLEKASVPRCCAVSNTPAAPMWMGRTAPTADGEIAVLLPAAAMGASFPSEMIRVRGLEDRPPDDRVVRFHQLLI